jgi:hypothetical protein
MKAIPPMHITSRTSGVTYLMPCIYLFLATGLQRDRHILITAISPAI